MKHIVYNRTSYDVSKIKSVKEFEKVMKPKFGNKDYVTVLKTWKDASLSKRNKKATGAKPEAKS